MWIQVMQHVFYGDISKMKWLKKTLGIYKDKKDILRCGGRLKNAPITIDQQNPILLPRKGHLQLLLIRKAHEDTNHGNIKAV